MKNARRAAHLFSHRLLTSKWINFIYKIIVDGLRLNLLFRISSFSRFLSSILRYEKLNECDQFKMQAENRNVRKNCVNAEKFSRYFSALIEHIFLNVCAVCWHQTQSKTITKSDEQKGMWNCCNDDEVDAFAFQKRRCCCVWSTFESQMSHSSWRFVVGCSRHGKFVRRLFFFISARSRRLRRQCRIRRRQCHFCASLRIRVSWTDNVLVHRMSGIFMSMRTISFVVYFSGGFYIT